jgi:hypothetical protein
MIYVIWMTGFGFGSGAGVWVMDYDIMREDKHGLVLGSCLVILDFAQ